MNRMAFENEQKRLINNLIFPIVISTPFAVGDVFSYLIKDEKIILVDCGHKSESSYQQVKSALNDQDLDIKDLDEIWLTHGHPDHFGQAALLAEQSGAIIKGHSRERANFLGNSDRHLFRPFFEQHHISSVIIDEMLNQLDWLQQYQEPIEPEWIDDGDQLRSGKLTFIVKHTPGHASGHIVFWLEAAALIFGGDVLLEHISTNALINFDSDSGKRNKSLLQYRDSLQWIRKRNGLVLPGHGKQINNIAEIAGHHLKEQNKRYQKIKKLLQAHPFTLMDLSETIFPEALQDGAHFLVFSEIMGYLDWGVQKKEIKQEDGVYYPIS